MIILFLFILGLSIGSFLNVLSDRWSSEEGIGGRSHCDYCKHTLSPLDLIPVISFVILGGRCRYCKKNLSWYYPVVEIVTGVSFVLIYIFWAVIPSGVEGSLASRLGGTSMRASETSSDILRFAQNDIILIACLFGIICSLIVIFFADLKYQIIPDEALVAMTFFTVPLILIKKTLPDSIFGGIVLTGLMYFLYFITRGRGMGFGDVKYALVMGLLLGLVGGLLGLYIAFITGAVVSMILIVFSQKGLKSKIPFGPFLIFGTLSMLFFGEKVITLVKTFFSL